MNEFDEMAKAMTEISAAAGDYAEHFGHDFINNSQPKDLEHIHYHYLETVKERNKRVLEDREKLMKQVIKKQRGRK